ncbi:MAG TPA: VWA domain-containing protein [Candidatus Angelobacter sp.]|nr:VWA domain-containing protein [Candidatus Angelobacter sp.]
MDIARAVLISVLVVILAPLTLGQDTLRTQTNVVLVPALVKDGAGNVVYGLQAKDFVIEDDGVSQTVRMDESAVAEPVSLVIALQTGRTGSAEFERIRTLSTMVDPILSQEGAQVAIVLFDSHVDLVRDFTDHAALIQKDLKKLRAGDGGAAILDAVSFSAGLLNQTPKGRQRVLLLISETRDHGSVLNIDEVVTVIGNSNIAIYTLAFSPTTSNILDDLRGKLEKKGDEVNVAELALKLMVLARQAMRKNAPKEIARLTGGEYELFKSHRGFEDHMVEFANHVHNRYLLSFQPKSPHPGLHEIRVRLKDTDSVSVLARENYWAKPE